MYNTTVLVETIRLCHMTRSSNIEDVLKRAVEIAFPFVLREPMKALIDAGREERAIIPKATTIHRCRLLFDVTLLLVERAHLLHAAVAGKRIIRFASADSSV
eukprot:8469107-Alexandrium_andersonii.AAC.1